MKVLEKKAIKELIKFYESYISGKNKGNMKQMAEELYNEYIPGSTMLSETINSAVGPLIDIYTNLGIAPLTKEEAKDILKKLKKYEKELNK